MSQPGGTLPLGFHAGIIVLGGISLLVKKPQGRNPNHLQARGLIEEARRQFLLGKVEQSEALLQQVLSINPRETQALVALGIVAAETGRLDIALSRMAQAIEADRTCTPAICWMSYLLLHDNRLDEARQFAEQAIAMDPRNPAAQAALARALARKGFAAEAITAFRRALDLQPNDPVVLYELADLLLSQRVWLDATEVLTKAVRLSPDPQGLLRLAYLELRLGRIDFAEKYCARALAKEPNAAEIHVLMARIFTEQMKLEQAAYHWNRGFELDAKPGFIHLERALSLSTMGQFDDAINELKQSIILNPVQGDAYQALVFAKKIGHDDQPLIQQMEDLLLDGGLKESERVSLHYSLGKSYDNLGDYRLAMEHFDQANALNLQAVGNKVFDRRALADLIDTNIEMFTPEFFAKYRNAGITSDLPIFVVGMMRSGTTLAEQLLTCHPLLGGAGEQTFWGSSEDQVIDFARMTVRASKLSLVANQYLDLLRTICPGFPHVIDKNPANLQMVGSIHIGLPNARIIHTRRSAVDTALSIWMTPVNTSAEFICDKGNIVFAYQEYMRLMDHWKAMLPKDRFLEVRYEDIVSQPDITVRQMVEFCGVEWNEACLHPERNERRVRTPSLWQVRQPLFKTSTEKWTKYDPWLGSFSELKGLS